jgi:hypothetical protein
VYVKELSRNLELLDSITGFLERRSNGPWPRLYKLTVPARGIEIDMQKLEELLLLVDHLFFKSEIAGDPVLEYQQGIVQIYST